MELHAFEQLAMQMEEAGMPRPRSVFPAVTPPGMAYVPFQQWGKVYDADTGLQRGTMFPVLDLPFQEYGGEKR